METNFEYFQKNSRPPGFRTLMRELATPAITSPYDLITPPPINGSPPYAPVKMILGELTPLTEAATLVEVFH